MRIPSKLIVILGALALSQTLPSSAGSNSPRAVIAVDGQAIDRSPKGLVIAEKFVVRLADNLIKSGIDVQKIDEFLKLKLSPTLAQPQRELIDALLSVSLDGIVFAIIVSPEATQGQPFATVPSRDVIVRSVIAIQGYRGRPLPQAHYEVTGRVQVDVACLRSPPCITARSVEAAELAANNAADKIIPWIKERN